MISPEEDDHRFDSSDEAADAFFDELFASPIPEVLPLDALADAHKAMSLACKDSILRPLESYLDEERAESLRSHFYSLLKEHYPEPEGGFPSIIRLSAFKEQYEDDSNAISIVVQLRSAHGSCMIGNNEQLYEVTSGPVLLWLREDAQREMIVRALYSDEAFENEMTLIKQASDDFLKTPEEFPLVFSALVQSIHSINRLFKGQISPISIDGITPSPELPDNVITLKNGEATFYVEIYCHEETRALSYLIHPRHKGESLDEE